jgi:perosamine synthetase
MNNDRILGAIRSVIPDGQAVSLHEPEFAGNEKKYLHECIDSTFVSSVGPFVDRFERELADYLGVQRAVAVVNGTAALHICLLLAGVERDDEVIVPTLTFVATANAVAYLGAIPHLADSDETTLGLDPRKLDAHLGEIAEVRGDTTVNRLTGRRIAAVMPMHTFGHPVAIDEIAEVCRRWGIPLVEDAAESLGSTYDGRHTGNFGLVAGLSFNGNKIMTTGGGGAVVTNDARLGELAKHITTTARTTNRSQPWAFLHDRTGFNYRMPNLNAALGCAQLEQLPQFVERKRALATAYAEAFEGMPGVSFFRESPRARSNYWLNALRIDDPARRDALLEVTNATGIGTRPPWTPMHELPMYATSPRMDLSASERIAATLINLPSSAFLGAAIAS